MLEFYSNYYLFSEKNSHSLARAICCCSDELPRQCQYNGRTLYIKTEKVPEP